MRRRVRSFAPPRAGTPSCTQRRSPATAGLTAKNSRSISPSSALNGRSAASYSFPARTASKAFAARRARPATSSKAISKPGRSACAFSSSTPHNPYGFAWLRRVNEDNVDLNRNYIDHHRPYPDHEVYDALKDDISPAVISGPAFVAATDRLRAYSIKYGAFVLQQAITAGQYRHPTGLYYGGSFPAWSNRTLTEALPRYLAHQRRVAMVDYHSGLGPFGYGEIISEYETGSGGDRRLRAWFGADAKSTRAGDSVSADLTGTLDAAIPRLLPHAETTAFAVEYGTIAPMEVFEALRADNWLHLWGDMKSDQARAIKAEIRRAFYPDTDEWKRKVWARSVDVLEKTARGLLELVPA